jgi:hypothetical protein
LSADWSVNGKRLIFTVTTGRSGTGYVCHLLQAVPGLCCKHEPQPKFSLVMRAAQTDPSVAERFLVERKLPAIRSIEDPTYFETGHLTCKGFLEPLLQHGVPFDLVLLRRDKRLIATSLLQLNTVPSRTALGLQFLLSPDDPDVLKLDRWQDLSDWALCYWYCLEIERRMTLYGDQVEAAGGRVIATAIDDLKTKDGLDALMSFVSNQNSGLSNAVPDRDKIINDKTSMKSFGATSGLSAAEMDRMAEEVESRILPLSQ